MKLIKPKKLPEANIQAKFYMRCWMENIPCILEYRVKGSRFDAVIHDHENIKCIVEFKNLSARGVQRRLDGKRKYKQIERYESHGVPVVLVLNESDLENGILAAKEHLYG